MPNDDIRTILVIRACALGDFILTLPAIGALRKRFPGARLEIMGYPHILALAEGRGYADRIGSFERGGMAAFFLQGSVLPPDLVTYFESLDLVFSLVSDREGVFADNLGRAGVSNLISYHPFPSTGRRVHIIDHLLRALEPLGVDGGDSRPRVLTLPSDRIFASGFLEEQGLTQGERLVALHPGSGGEKKVWSLEAFSQVADWAEEKLEATVLIISGPADADQAHRVAGRMRKRPIIVEGLSVVELASVLERCELFVGNDSGVTHLSWGVGVKTLAIFGPSDPLVWGPRGEGTLTLRRGENLDLIRPRDVIAGLKRLVNC